MFNSSEILPFYVVFHTIPPSNLSLLTPSPFPQHTNIFWGIPLASTNSYIDSEWPQKYQNNSFNIPLFQHNLPSTTVGVEQDSVRVVRRPKCKRVRNSEKELESAKKNSESNIVNQLYSFFSSYQKSEGVVQRAILLLNKKEDEMEKIKYLFYNTIRLINYRRGRKYVNKDNVLHYYTPYHFIAHVPDIQQKLAEINLLTLQQLCFLFRVTTTYFIRNTSVAAILTSKRISVLAKGEHLKRRRKVLHSFYLQHQ